jgi:hypothetical protein
MRRIAGVIIFVLGVLLIVLGILKILPGAASTGIFAILVGGVIFGLSFIKPQDAGPDAPPPLSLVEKLTGVFYEPARVFENLRFHPRWFASFLVIAVCMMAYNVAFVQRMTPEVVAAAPIDKAAEGGFIPPEALAKVRSDTIDQAKTPAARVFGPLNVAGGIFLYLLFIGALYLLCVMAFGGRLNYWQALSVAAYASLPPIVIQSILSIVLLYIKSPDDIDPIKGQRGLVRADLGVLFSPADHPYLYTLAGAFGILTLYGLWLTATGLRNTSQKLSMGSAWAIALILWAIGLVFALSAAALFPTFI